MTTSGKRIVILQSNYIPWKGYFDLMAAADEFVIYDEVQFTKNDWRNRNRIVLNGKPHWLTIAVKTSGKFGQSIDSIEVSNTSWASGHWQTLRQAYARAPHFRSLSPVLEAAYREAASLSRLTEVNELFLKTLALQMGLSTPLVRSSSVPRTSEDPTGRLIDICKARGASAYISGPAAKAYLDQKQFLAAGIELFFANYSDYPVYSQSSGTFEHGVSVIDLLMNCGPDARGHLKSFQRSETFLNLG